MKKPRSRTRGTNKISDTSNISNISNISNLNGLGLRFVQGVNDEELAPMQGRICGWFAARGWRCAYARLGNDGRLEEFQSGASDYCEWAHYADSGPYDWFGRNPLTREMTPRHRRARMFLPSGRETRRWSAYTAIILLPARKEMQWSTAHGRHVLAWNGKPPQLWWHRERCNLALYERRRARYEAKHDYKRLDYLLAFRLSGYVPEVEAASLKVPADFVASAGETLREFSEALGFESAKPRHKAGETAQ